VSVHVNKWETESCHVSSCRLLLIASWSGLISYHPQLWLYIAPQSCLSLLKVGDFNLGSLLMLHMRYWALQGTGKTLWPSDDDYFNGTCAGNCLFAVRSEGWLFALWLRVALPRSGCCAQCPLHRHLPSLVDLFLVLHNLCTAIMVMWINHQLFTRPEHAKKLSLRKIDYFNMKA